MLQLVKVKDELVTTDAAAVEMAYAAAPVSDSGVAVSSTDVRELTRPDAIEMYDAAVMPTEEGTHDMPISDDAAVIRSMDPVESAKLVAVSAMDTLVPLPNVKYPTDVTVDAVVL